MAKTTIILTGCGGTPAQNVAWCLRSGGDHYRLVGVECDQYRVFLTTGFDRKYLVPRAEESNYVSVLNDIIEARLSDDSYWLRGLDVSPVLRRVAPFPKAGQVCE